MAQTLSDAQPGDMIEISHGLYEEWAVYVGNNEVVYLILRESEDTKRHLIVKCDDIKKVNGKCLKVNNLLDNECKPRQSDVIVNEAREMVDKEWISSLSSRVSEHFARELRYGKTKKRQHNAKPGDLIEIDRGPYQHWALYVGEDDVVHFTNQGFGGCAGPGCFAASRQAVGTGEVTRDNIWEVSNTDHFEVKNHLDGDCPPRDPDAIVKDALAMVGKKQLYSVATSNCEHFVTKLRYGKAVSKQVKRVSGSVATGLR